MRIIFSIFIIFLIIFLQIIIFPHLKFNGVVPNLFLVFTILIGLYYSKREALLGAIFCGLLMDLFSGWPFGVFTVILLCISLIFIFIKNYIFTQLNLTVFLLAVFAGTILFNLLAVLLSLFYSLQTLAVSLPFYEIFYLLPFEIVLNLAVAIFVGIIYLAINRIFIFNGVRSNF